MKLFRNTVSFSVALFTFLVLGFLYFEFKKNSQQQHENEIYNYINKLEKLDAVLDRQVLLMDSWSFRNYDAVNFAYKEFADLLNSSPVLPIDLKLTIPKLRKQLEHKFELIEQFKSNNSVLRNSLNYLPEIAEKLNEAIEQARQQNRLINEEANLYKQYVMLTVFQRITSQFIEHQLVPERLNVDVKSIPKELVELWSNMNVHLNIVIDFKHRNLLLNKELENMQLHEGLVELNRQFSDHLLNTEKSRQYQKGWLLSAAFTVVSLIILLSFVVRYYRGKQNKHNDEVHTDSLTGLANRRSLEPKLHHYLHQVKLSNDKLGVVFIDLDGFKEVNDTFGHQEGDILLQTVARNLQSAVRSDDAVFRLGGDEFVVVLPRIGAEVLEKITQKLLDQCTLSVVVDGKSLSVSASLGVSVYPDDTVQTKELIDSADKAMYQAKRDGKSCYRFYSGMSR